MGSASSVGPAGGGVAAGSETLGAAIVRFPPPKTDCSSDLPRSASEAAELGRSDRALSATEAAVCPRGAEATLLTARAALLTWPYTLQPRKPEVTTTKTAAGTDTFSPS